MMLPDFKALYKPYEGVATLEETITWLLKQCKGKGVSEELAQKAVNITFLEMADGKQFPTDAAGTAFEGLSQPVPHACMNLYLLAKAEELHAKASTAYMEATQGMLQARINSHIRRSKNREYWEHLKKDSPVIRLFVRKDNG